MGDVGLILSREVSRLSRTDLGAASLSLSSVESSIRLLAIWNVSLISLQVAGRNYLGANEPGGNNWLDGWTAFPKNW